jgi:hypothetical protein
MLIYQKAFILSLIITNCLKFGMKSLQPFHRILKQPKRQEVNLILLIRDVLEQDILLTSDAWLCNSVFADPHSNIVILCILL